MEENEKDMSDLIRFLDADTYKEKLRILDDMRGELDDLTLNNMAASLDIIIQDGVDGYEFIRSELKLKSRFEIDMEDYNNRRKR